MHKGKTKLKLKNASGITLIALIVTIIVLLILAGVTISLTMNDRGIFQKTKNSVSLHVYSQAEEEAKLEGANLVTQRYEEHGITLADSAKQAYADLKVDSNATKGWIAVSYSESKNAIYVTYKDKNLLKGFKSSEAGIAIFEIDLLNDGGIKPNPELPPDKKDYTGPISVEMTASDVKSTSITVTVTVTSENGMPDKPEYTYYLNGEQKTTIKDTTYTYSDLTPETEYTLKVSTKDKNGNNVETKITSTTGKEEISTHEIQVGDYVNYTPPTGKRYTVAAANSGHYADQTFDSSNEAINTWRVWKVDKVNNTIEILSSDVTKEKLTLGCAPGYNNGPKIMNNICLKLFSNSNKGITARSLDEEDLQDAMSSNWNIPRKSNAFTEKIKSLDSLYGLNSNYGLTFTQSNYSLPVPNCYTQSDITDQQNNDLRPNSSSDNGGYTEKSNVKYKISYYDFNLHEAIDKIRESFFDDDHCWIASRCVRHVDDPSNEEHTSWPAYNIRVIDGDWFTSMEVFGSYDPNNPSIAVADFSLSPIATLSSSLPTYVSTNSSTGYNTWQIN